MIGEVISMLREKRGFSQVDFAKKLGMTCAQLCKIEKGVNVPREATVGRIADALGISVQTLKGYLLPDECGYVAIRKEALDLSATLKSVIELDEEINAIEKKHEVRSATTIPLVYGYLREPHASEILARSLRDSLGVGTAAFSNLAMTLEFANVRIHRMKLPENVLSASWWNRERETLTIVLAENCTIERQIFRLAYELGAACLFRSAGNETIPEMKKERKILGEFAADFLMPAATVADMVAKAGIKKNGWTLRQLCVLKAHFGVSAESFVIRLLELGLIEKVLRNTLRNEIRKYYAAHPQNKEPEPSARDFTPGERWKVMEG